MGFTKLDEGILQSSVMLEEPPTFKVWVALLASCGPDGIARVSSVFLSSVCHLDLTVTDKALETLGAPDPRSRSVVEEGRRIKRVDGGYFLVNYEKYRSFTYSMTKEAIRQRKHRELGRVVTGRDAVGHERDSSVTSRDGHDHSAFCSSASSSLGEEKTKKDPPLSPPARKEDPGIVAARHQLVAFILKDLGLKVSTLEYITHLTFEFQEVDWEEELARKVAHVKDHPLKQTANVALQFRNWFVNARKFAAERTRNDQVGAQQPAAAKPLVKKDDFKVAQDLKIAEIMLRYKGTLEAIEAENPYDPYKMQAVKLKMRGELEDWAGDYLREKNEHIQPSTKEEEEGPL